MVFLPENSWYGIWAITLSIFSIFNALQYPYFVAFGFPDIHDFQMYMLYLGEFMVAMNIIISCFCAYKNEGDEQYTTNFNKIYK